MLLLLECFVVSHRLPKGCLQLVVTKATNLATKKQRGNLFSSLFFFYWSCWHIIILKVFVVVLSLNCQVLRILISCRHFVRINIHYVYRTKIFTCCFEWIWHFVSHFIGIMWIECFCEQGAEKNIWTQNRESNKRMEKIVKLCLYNLYYSNQRGCRM